MIALACGRRVLAGLLVLFIVAPTPGLSAPAAAVGTARGVRGVELSLDGGKIWLPLGARSLPVLSDTAIRTTTGGAVLDLADGSRLTVLPLSSLRLRETGTATEVSLLAGRLTFRLPQETRVELRSASARLTAQRTQAMAGEVFVGGDDTIGLRMTEGTLQVEELAGAKRTMLASLEPVFLPKRPATTGPVFASEVQATAPPAGARAVFSPKGESLGFLDKSQLVIYPGYTANLTRPFSTKLVQLAMARVPEKDRNDATPVFDVNGGYLGYLAGPTFVAQAVGVPQQQQIAQQTGPTPPPPPDNTQQNLYILLGVVTVAGGLTAACLTELICPEGNGSGGASSASGGPATALRPRR
jgi:hypothetical protein